MSTVSVGRATYLPLGNASDTRMTKILLATLERLSACDRYLLIGLIDAVDSKVYLGFASASSVFIHALYANFISRARLPSYST